MKNRKIGISDQSVLLMAKRLRFVELHDPGSAREGPGSRLLRGDVKDDHCGCIRYCVRLFLMPLLNRGMTVHLFYLC